MHRSFEVVDEHGPREAQLLGHRSGDRFLLLEARMSGIAVARMGLTRVNEEELALMLGIFRRHILESRSRLRAIRSREGPELDDRDSSEEVVGQTDPPAISRIDQLPIRRFAPDTRPLRKRNKILHVTIEGKVHIVVNAHHPDLYHEARPLKLNQPPA